MSVSQTEATNEPRKLVFAFVQPAFFWNGTPTVSYPYSITWLNLQVLGVTWWQPRCPASAELQNRPSRWKARSLANKRRQAWLGLLWRVLGDNRWKPIAISLQVFFGVGLIGHKSCELGVYAVQRFEAVLPLTSDEVMRHFWWIQHRSQYPKQMVLRNQHCTNQHDPTIPKCITQWKTMKKGYCSPSISGVPMIWYNGITIH